MAGRLVWDTGLPSLARIEDKLEEGVTSIRDSRLGIHQFFSYVLTPGLSLGILNMRLDTYLRTCLLESRTVNLNKQDPCIGNSFDKPTNCATRLGTRKQSHKVGEQDKSGLDRPEFSEKEKDGEQKEKTRAETEAKGEKRSHDAPSERGRAPFRTEETVIRSSMTTR
jgi:hypothetical protein